MFNGLRKRIEHRDRSVFPVTGTDAYVPPSPVRLMRINGTIHPCITPCIHNMRPIGFNEPEKFNGSWKGLSPWIYWRMGLAKDSKESTSNQTIQLNTSIPLHFVKTASSSCRTMSSRSKLYLEIYMNQCMTLPKKPLRRIASNLDVLTVDKGNTNNNP